MSIFDDLVKNLAERNIIMLDGEMTIGLVNGGVKLQGEINSTIQDKKTHKTVATMLIPLSTKISIVELDIPLRNPK